MSKTPRKPEQPLSESSSSSEDGPDAYEHDDFVVPDDYVDPDPEADSSQSKKRKKRRIRLRHTKRASDQLDPEDLELVAASQQIKAKDKDELEEALFSAKPEPQEQEKPVSKRRKKEENGEDSDADFIEPEDGEILEETMEAGKGQVSTALSIFGATAIYTPKEPVVQPPTFEPSDIISRFATSEDEVIRVTDIPERLQSTFARRMHPSESELEAETDWLLNKIVVQKGPGNFQELKMKIREFLQMYRVEKFEVPFIATYRLQVLSPELIQSDLWDLYRWDLDWAFIYDQKAKLADTLSTAMKAAKEQALGRPPDAGQRILVTGSIPEDVTQLLTRSSPDDFISELSDLTQFSDIFVYTVKDSGCGKRVVSRKQMLSDARRSRLDEFALKAGLTPAQMVDNIKAGKKVHWPQRTTMKPQDLAFEYMSGDYNEEFRVLHTVCMLMKGELAAMPGFRAFVRHEYQSLMRVVTTPTERGKLALDIFHPAYRVKHLGHGKSADTFEGDMWAEVVKCETEGLIQVELKLPWADAKDDRILSKLKPFYLSEDIEDETESDWNGFRTEVLRHALAEVYEALATETRKMLMYKAEDYILRECKRKYGEMLSKPGFSRPDESVPVRVFAFVADPTTAKFGQVALAALDGEGELVDSALFTALIKGDKETFHHVDDDRHKSEKRSLQQMLLAQRPDVLVVAANCLHAMQLRKIVSAQARLMSEGFQESEVDWQVDQTQLLQRAPVVVIGDLEVPKLFSESHRAKRMFPDFNPLLRQAVSLGRSLQSPISEVLGLWMDPNENLTGLLKLHRLQKLIPEKQLLNALEVEAVQAASLRGADLNRMFDHPHFRPLLNFISGLGPIKAHGIFERMISSGPVLLRTELITRQLVTKLVYQNCAGFVIIKAEDKSDPLDKTRIHPEHYDLAKKIAASALENARDEDESNVEKAMNAPALVKEVDLDNYANYLEARGRKHMKEILELIVREFAQPFHLATPPFEDMPGDTVLYCVSGETQYTLRRGLLVQAYITSNADGRIRARLESGLDALVIADDSAVEKLQQGTNIRARVIEVRVNVKSPEVMFFNVKLSVMADDLTDHVKFKDDITGLARLDEAAFIIDDADWTEKSLMEDDHQLGQKYVPRVVNHPKYRNVGLKTACSELEQKEIGDHLFRPSSRGTDHLTCTMKFYDFVYCHLDIIEEGKPTDNMLGTKFKIGDESYESLQEIVERYLVPISTLTKEAIGHNKFKDITGHGIDYIDMMLKAEKKSAPSFIPYYFTIAPHYPQFLVLSYLPKERIIREYIKVKPKGLFFHECYHPNIHFLISWFKKHYCDSTYQGQLARSKPPVIATANQFAIPGKVLTEVPQANVNREDDSSVTMKTPERVTDTPLQRTPGYGEMTPYNRTPHIGNQEWAGGATLKQTPRADDWEAERNFDSFVPPQETKPQPPADSWAKPQPTKPQDPVSSSSANPPTNSSWEVNPSQSAGASWGPPAASSDQSWGAPSGTSKSTESTWGAAPSKDSGSGGAGWGATTTTQDSTATASWGAATTDSSAGGWGSSGTASSTSWGNASAGATTQGSSWGASGTGTSWGASSSSSGGDSRGERGRGGRGARRGGRGCFKCGEEGHMSKDCTKPGTGGGGPRACFKCGEEGHMSRECPKAGAGGGAGGSKACFKCGEEGHMSRECPKAGAGGGGGGSKACFKCGEEGHMSRECPKAGGGGGGAGGSRACFKCGQEGHMSRECPNAASGGGGGGGGSRACFNCGKEGHMSKDCTEERKPREFRGERRGRGRRGGGEMHSGSTSGGWGGSGGSSGASTGWGASASSGASTSGWGGGGASTGGWGAPATDTSTAAPSQSAWGAPTAQSSSTDAWGAAPSSSGADPWGAPTSTPTPASTTPQSSDPWGAPTSTPTPASTTPQNADTWGAAPVVSSQSANPAGTDPWALPSFSATESTAPVPNPPPTEQKPNDAWGGGGWGPSDGKTSAEGDKWQ